MAILRVADTLITDDTSELIVVAKETIDGMFSERYAVVGASAIISVAVEPIVASVNTVDGVVAVPFTVSIAVVFVDEVAVGDADLVDPMSRVFVDDVLIVSDATVDVIAVMTEAVDGVIPLIPSVFVVVIGLFGVITVDGVDVAVFVTRGGHLGIFWWVCAARDSKLAPRSKKKFP